MRTIQQFRDGLQSILGAVPRIYQLQPIGSILEEILKQLLPMVKSEDAFILVDDIPGIEQAFEQVDKKSIYRGIGDYDVDIEEFMELP